MKITSVDFYGAGRGNFLRYAAIVIDGAIVLRGIKLIERPDRSILIAMPSQKKIDDTHEEIAHPVNHEARKALELAVLTAWATFPRVVVEK
jgi:DNA-binding cell septation regulator SpoVG